MYDIKRFILDEKLKKIADSCDHDALTAYKRNYAGDEDTIDQAVLLLQNLKINFVRVPQEQIDEDFQKLLLEIKRRKKVRLIPAWLSVASVACACAVFMLLPLFNTPSVPDIADDNTHLLSMLDSLDKSSNEIQLVYGSTKATVANNDAISQTEKGDIIVGTEEKVKSADIQTEFVQLVVPNGKRTSIKFNDGTVAWVNSGSKLLYPKVFADDKREIFIDGEIYIEVEKAADKPFFVHTKQFDISVLGTKFNVSAYSEDSENSVVLIEGSVEVEVENNKQKLLPNQGLFTENGDVKIKRVDTEIYTGWKDGIMKVNGETLDNMFMKLSRYYDVKIQCNDQYIAQDIYQGKLDLRKPISEVLYNLSLSTPFIFSNKTDDKVISIVSKQ